MNTLDSLFSGMRVASSGLAAERLRMDVITENIANARITRTPEGGPYRRKLIHFEPLVREAFLRGESAPAGVGVASVSQDFSSDFVRIRERGHPDADADGMVTYPNVNTVVEMADLVTSMRAYEANLSAQQGFVQMAQKALELMR